MMKSIAFLSPLACIAAAVVPAHAQTQAWIKQIGTIGDDYSSAGAADGSEEIYLMSEDHSAVMEMVRRGKLSLADARQHEDKNIILRALGPQPTVQVSTWNSPFPVRDGDQFVLCSDGLYDLVSDEELCQIVTHYEPTAATECLISLARKRGGHDNITAGVIRFTLGSTGILPALPEKIVLP